MIEENKKSDKVKCPWFLSGWIALALDAAWVVVFTHFTHKGMKEAIDKESWENCGKLIYYPRWEHAVVWIFFVIAVALLLYAVAVPVWKIVRYDVSLAREVVIGLPARILPAGIVFLFALTELYGMTPFRNVCGG